MSDVEQLARVPPLVLVGRRGGQRDREDLVADARPGIRGGQAEPAEHLDVDTELELVVHFGAEVAIAEELRHRDAARADAERFILRGEPRGAAGRAVRRVQLQLAHLVGEPPWFQRHAPGPRHAAKGLPAMIGTEQRAAVPPQQSVEDVAFLVLEVRPPKHTHLPDALRIRRDRLVLRRVVERVDSLEREKVAGAGLDRAVALFVRGSYVHAPPQIATEVVADRCAHARVQLFSRCGVPENIAQVDHGAAVRAAPDRRTESFVAKLLRGRAPQVVTQVAFEVQPVGGGVLDGRPTDEAVGEILAVDVLEIVQRVLVLRAAPLQVGPNEQPAQRVALRDVYDSGHPGQPEERPAAVLLIEAVL